MAVDVLIGFVYVSMGLLVNENAEVYLESFVNL